MPTTTHIAGPMLCLKEFDRCIQRCVACGFALVDMRPSRTAVPEGQSPEPLAFAEKQLVEVASDGTYGSVTRLGILGDFRWTEIPANFCLKRPR